MPLWPPSAQHVPHPTLHVQFPEPPVTLATPRVPDPQALGAFGQLHVRSNEQIFRAWLHGIKDIQGETPLTVHIEMYRQDENADYPATPVLIAAATLPGGQGDFYRVPFIFEAEQLQMVGGCYLLWQATTISTGNAYYGYTIDIQFV